MVSNQLLVAAKRMLELGQDYDDVEPGLCLASFPDGVWLVDCSQTCNMDDMPKLQMVLPSVVKGPTHFVLKVVYRGLLGSQGYYVQASTLQHDGAIMRRYVSLNDIVWC